MLPKLPIAGDLSHVGPIAGKLFHTRGRSLDSKTSVAVSGTLYVCVEQPAVFCRKMSR